MIRIGCGQGFWGDWQEGPVHLVEDGPLDYLILDYLAEVTMSVLQKQRRRNPELGYARDFPPLIARLAPQLKQKQVRVLANAGGVNPVACARELRRLAPELTVAVVLGDDLMPRIPQLIDDGHPLRNIDTGEPMSTISNQVLSANVYLGAYPLAEALASGADVVITGRCADAALALAPMIHHYKWHPEEHDKLAGGILAGHVIECGAQCTGGNCQADWQSIPNFAHIGFPVLEAYDDGSAVVTKHAGSGGRVNAASVKEQIVYEIGDPSRYFTPDVIADFTSTHVEDLGEDRVRLTGTRGLARPEQLKVSASYAWGYKTTAHITYCWPDALEKAKTAEQMVRQRLREQGLEFESLHVERFGIDACHGHLAPMCAEYPEVQLRMAARGFDKAPLDAFTRELIALVLAGPPTATGYGDGRPEVRDVVAYWPALVDRDQVHPTVEYIA